jgi:hypothetical protein
MDIFPLTRLSGAVYAFEIENAYISLRTVAKILRTVPGVSHVETVSWFVRLFAAKESRATFQFHNHEFVVCEPFGDNSRFWIGPRNPESSAVEIEPLQRAFLRHRPSLVLHLTGNLVSLRLSRRRASTQDH